MDEMWKHATLHNAHFVALISMLASAKKSEWLRLRVIKSYREKVIRHKIIIIIKQSIREVSYDEDMATWRLTQDNIFSSKVRIPTLKPRRGAFRRAWCVVWSALIIISDRTCSQRGHIHSSSTQSLFWGKKIFRLTATKVINYVSLWKLLGFHYASTIGNGLSYLLEYVGY